MRRLLGGLIPLATALAVGSCATFDPGADPYAWALHREGSEAKLAYGVPNSDSVGLMMTCAPGSGRVALSRMVPTESAASGIALTSNGRQGTFWGRAESAGTFEQGSAFLTATAGTDAAVLQAFRTSGRLSVKTDAGDLSMPSTPAERVQIAEFFAACG